jgi:hypothetical protein
VRTAELVRAYADLPLGAVDASVIAVGERLKLTDVATLDRRHLTVVRPGHAAALNLLHRTGLSRHASSRDFKRLDSPTRPTCIGR